MLRVAVCTEPQSVLSRMSQSRFLRKFLGRPYLRMNMWIWRRLPASVTSWRPVLAYGAICIV